MLTRSKPMARGTRGLKRSGFSRRPVIPTPSDPDARRAARAERMAVMAGQVARSEPRQAIAPDFTPAPPIEKDNPLRSERYRRIVASMPCASCGITGYSQHAHENEGKGLAMKVDDRRAMPLCCTRPDAEGCHVAFDQYRLVPGGRDAHVALGRAMAARTRAQIMEAGRWPARLPHWRETDDET